jgi:hypothetical protein
MNPLTERAAMGLARLYGHEDDWQRYETPAQAVLENIGLLPDETAQGISRRTDLPVETVLAVWQAAFAA